MGSHSHPLYWSSYSRKEITFKITTNFFYSVYHKKLVNHLVLWKFGEPMWDKMRRAKYFISRKVKLPRTFTHYKILFSLAVTVML